MIPRARPVRSQPPSESDVGSALRPATPAVVALRLSSVGAAHLLLDAREHRRLEEQVDQIRIELSSLPLANRRHRLLEAARVTVTAAMGDRIEAVGDGDDAGLQRDASAF